jgi:hypothetical protein
MGVLLQHKGYLVTVLEDTDAATFVDHFYQFARSLRAGSTVVVHFSGHGCQVAGPHPNRLVFVDQTIAEAAKGGLAPVFVTACCRFGLLCPPSLFPCSLQTPIAPLTP